MSTFSAATVSDDPRWPTNVLQLDELANAISGHGGYSQHFLSRRLPASIEGMTVGELLAVMRQADADFNNLSRRGEIA